LALQGLCCLDVQGERALDLVEDFLKDSREDPGTIDSARTLLVDTFVGLDRVDELLMAHARHWDLSRLALVDRNILRLGTQELLSGRVPFRVIISEGLRLAQEFSTSESPRFVNGVLDAIARTLWTEGEKQPTEEGD
jgi:N utilization substance protein B